MTYRSKADEADLPSEVTGSAYSLGAPPSYSSQVGSKEVLAVDVEDVEEESERGHWGGQLEFILSCLGYAVGLGNVWRFPYLCYENGGGAFLIPYFIMLVFVGLPVFFIELIIGQYSGEGPVNALLKASPLFQGVGVGMIIISFLGSIYYNMIIAWSLYYMFASFTSELPWDGCSHDYNTELCYNKVEAIPCEDKGGLWFNLKCYNTSQVNDTGIVTSVSYMNMTLTQLMDKQSSAPEEFFNFYMLDRLPNMEVGDGGGLKWDIVLCLLLAWILCFLCIIKGIKSSGKVVYFTATFPYLVLVILFFRAVTLEGAGKGIEFYLKPDFKKLASGKVWADAAGQIFFSLSVGMGGLMTFASYNKFHTNVFRDTMIVTIGNCLTSFFAGFVIFSILGHMAHYLKKEVPDVVQSGSGLAFIAYPEVVTRLPAAPLWSFLFFFMLLTLGLDSQFAGLENIQTAFVDTWPRFRPYKTWVALVLCIIMFILGLSMTARTGIYWEELISYYSSGWSLVLMGLAEAIVFPWVYGADRLLNDLEHMIGSRPCCGCQGWYWYIIWKFVSPVLLIAILIFNFYEFTPLSYGTYLLPDWAQAFGWMMALASVLVIPIFAAYHLYQDYKYEDGTLWQRIKRLSSPRHDWIPAIEKNRKSKPAAAADNKAYTSSQSTIGASNVTIHETGI